MGPFWVILGSSQFATGSHLSETPQLKLYQYLSLIAFLIFYCVLSSPLKMAPKIGGEIEKVDGRSLTFDQFVDRYMKPNLPVVLTGLTDTWQSRTDWVQESDPTKPDLSFFSSLCSCSTVQVQFLPNSDVLMFFCYVALICLRYKLVVSDLLSKLVILSMIQLLEQN